jgi:hypothetical protein
VAGNPLEVDQETVKESLIEKRSARARTHTHTQREREDRIKELISKVEKLTVPSRIFNSACCTPSPETSLLRLMLSACEAMQSEMSKREKKKGKIYDKCINELIIQRAHLLCYFINFINIYDPLLSSSYVKISSLKCKKRKVKSLAAALGNKI